MKRIIFLVGILFMALMSVNGQASTGNDHGSNVRKVVKEDGICEVYIYADYGYGYVIAETSSGNYDTDDGHGSEYFEVEEGETITLTAESSDDDLYRFVSWDDGETNPSRTETITEDMVFTAIFEEIPTYTITAEAYPSDAVANIYAYANNYIDEGGNWVEVVAGEVVTLEVDEDDIAEGYTFSGWYDGDQLISYDLFFYVDAAADNTYTAKFEEIPTYTVTISANDEYGYVDITIPEGDVNGVTDYSTSENSGTIMFTVQEGAVIQLSAETQGDLYYFTGWSDGDTKRAHSDIIIGSNITLTANFGAYTTYTITAVADPSDAIAYIYAYANDYIDEDGNWVEVVGGEIVTLEVNEEDIAEGYTFLGWYDGNQLVSTNLSNTVIANADKTYTAKFEAIPTYTVTISANDEYGYVDIHIPEGDVNEVTDYSTSEKSGTITFTVQEGTAIQLSADTWDDYLYYFTGWSDGETGFEHSEIIVGSDITLTANFEAYTTYTITAVTDPVDIGNLVSLSYVNYASEGDNWVEVVGGEIVTLEVDDNDGDYTFVGWYDGNQLVSTNLSYIVTANADKTYTAKFAEIPTYTVTISANDTYGYVNISIPDGDVNGETEYSTSDNSGTVTFIVQEGAVIQLSAETRDEYLYPFTGWSDGITELVHPDIIVESNLTLTANFGVNTTYTITAVVDPADAGSISLYYEDYASEGDNWVEVAGGEEVTLEVDEDEIAEGYTFLGWYDGNERVSSNLSYTVTANADKTYTAKFEAIPTYTVTISANDEYGYVDIHINGEKEYSTSENSGTITFTVQEGTAILLTVETMDDYLYSFTGWSDAETDPVHSEILVGSDITLTAYFEAYTTYTITAVADPAEAGSVSLHYEDYANEGAGWVEVVSGEEVTLEVDDSNEDYTFMGWYDGNERVSTDLSYAVTVNASKTYTAKFGRIYTITAEADPSDAVAYVYASADDYIDEEDNWVVVIAGETVTLEVNEDDIKYGYRFLGWYDGDQLVSNNLSCSVAADADKTYTAKFDYMEKTLYLTLDDPSWLDDLGLYAVKYLDEDGEYVWTDFMELVEDERHIYSTTITGSFSELYFARFDEDAYEEGIDDNYIEDIEQATLPGNQDDMYVITANGENYWANYSQLPFLNINKNSITISQAVIMSNATGSQTVAVEGINLTEPITVAIHANSGVFQADVLALHVEGGNVTVTYDVNTTNTNIEDTLYITSSGLTKKVLLRANIFITEHAGTKADPLVPSEMVELQNRNYAYEPIYVKGVQKYKSLGWSYSTEYHLVLWDNLNNSNQLELECTVNNKTSPVKITPFGQDIISGDTVLVILDSYSGHNAIGRLIAYWQMPVDEQELALLRAAYAKMDNGATWTEKWDLTNTASLRNSCFEFDSDLMLITRNSSFEFDLGHIIGIDLYDNGVEGTIPAELFQLPYLETLDISHNAVEGIEPHANNSLVTMDVSYNRIAELSAVVNALPNLTDLFYDNQDIRSAYTIFIEDTISEATLTASVPDILTFRSMPSDLYISRHDEAGVLEWQTGLSSVEDGYSWDIHWTTGHNGDFIYTPEDTLWVLDEENAISFPVFFTYADGDADFSGMADVLDLQAEINHIFDEYYENAERPFNFTAANLYTDAVINVQDIVKLVSLLSVQELPSGAPMPRRHSSHMADGDAEAELYWSNGELHLVSNKPVAAMDIHLAGNSEIEWLVNTHTVSTTSTANSLHTIIYSLVGNTFPANTDIVIARISDRQASVLYAVLADKAARRINVAWYEEEQSTPTSLDDIDMHTEADTWTLYTVFGQKVAHGEMNNLADINTIISGQGGYLLMLQDKNNNVVFTGKLIIK